MWGRSAAVHAMRRLVQKLPTDHVIVKLDFSNAFNCTRRDVILDAVAAQTLKFTVWFTQLIHANRSWYTGIINSDQGKAHKFGTTRRPIGVTGIL